MNVLQDWTQGLNLMQQTVLLTAMRGPDGLRKDHPAKALLRAYRRVIVNSAFDKRPLDIYEEGGGSFTGPCIHPDGIEGVMKDFIKSVDDMPLHFVLHVIHATEIIGYKHPNRILRELWNNFYQAMCNDFHMNPETEGQMDHRLSDNRNNWVDAQKTALGYIIS